MSRVKFGAKEKDQGYALRERVYTAIIWVSNLARNYFEVQYPFKYAFLVTSLIAARFFVRNGSAISLILPLSEGVCKVVSNRLRRALSTNALCPVKLLPKRNEGAFTHTLSEGVCKVVE